jgi:hypothetical protein
MKSNHITISYLKIHIWDYIILYHQFIWIKATLLRLTVLRAHSPSWADGDVSTTCHVEKWCGDDDHILDILDTVWIVYIMDVIDIQDMIYIYICGYIGYDTIWYIYIYTVYVYTPMFLILFWGYTVVYVQKILTKPHFLCVQFCVQCQLYRLFQA